MAKLQNKNAVITGASSGIGQAIAIAFAKEGANLVITYQNNKQGAEKIQKAIQHLGRQCHVIQVSLMQDEDLSSLITESVRFLGGIDILVNNAATLTRHENFLDIPIAEFDVVQAVNYRAPFILTQSVANVMRQQSRGGSIINISSVSTQLLTPGLTHYECSKAALDMLTKSSASALARYHIRVNAISPGLIETNMNAHQRDMLPGVWQKRCARVPLQRSGQPNDIVPMAVLLASDESAWITGAIIGVDGGMAVAPYI